MYDGDKKRLISRDAFLNRFIHGDDATRNLMLKLIPHIADGSAYG